ncbi:putative GNAT family acetyltransferase [Nocardia puris]|uniref:Putative GNAT family acetyltransferase n=2 Tax=Nocardia puris TaxID=208602 RepID=A0A366DR62_9NOCA|nr:putative GNAT family acetyltransferase [Nocardia puris]
MRWMRIEITSDAAAYRAAAAPFLDRDPLRHSVIATAVSNLLTGLHGEVGTSFFLSARDADDVVVGAAMRTAGRDAYLGALPEGGAVAVAEVLAGVAPDNGGVEATLRDADAFAQRWCALLGVEARERYRTRLFRLEELHAPAAPPGAPRRATEADVDPCVAWAAAMNREALGSAPGLSADAIRARVAAGRWWLWEVDDVPVSLVAHQVPVAGWSRIGPVYTPPAERGRGYASALTAHVSRVLRADGLDVCLFTDLANPTSNKIYRAIGYRPVHDFVNYGFG